MGNAIDRYNLGGMKDLIYNKDGSLDIFIQAEEPKKLKLPSLSNPPTNFCSPVSTYVYEQINILLMLLFGLGSKDY